MSQDVVAEITAIYQRLGPGLVDVAPPGWASIELRSTVVDTVNHHSHWATAPDGARLECAPMAPNTVAAIIDLRSAFYQDSKGAWLSMSCSISADGQIAIDVNYDDEPGWQAWVPDAAYAADLARFPRDAEHIPAWMAAKLTSTA